jgi:hypothetical protein
MFRGAGKSVSWPYRAALVLSGLHRAGRFPDEDLPP